MDISTSSVVKSSKEKRNWFHSLTRKKSHSQTLTRNLSTATTSASESIRNNNNDVQDTACPQTSVGDEDYNVSVTTVSSRRKRKDEKNVLQRLAKIIGLRLHSLSRNPASEDEADAATTDASSEFVTQTSRLQPEPSALTFTFAQNDLDDNIEIIPFTQDYQRFIVKKWLEGESGPNRVMYTTCSEMLNQVWYWGEISRRDAQRVLTDKPTGSFLVRDSESSGSQFTLSFRIMNVTLHYRIEHRENYWHFEELQYESIVEMIEDILRRCTNDNFICFVRVPNEMQPPFPVVLKYPLSRYIRMPQLQDLCRRAIQRNLSTEEINKLPVPTKLIEYLHEKRELVF